MGPRQLALSRLGPQSAAAAAAVIGLAAVSAFAGVKLAALRQKGPAPIVVQQQPARRAVPCDSNGVTVRYVVGYRRALADYAVGAVRIEGLAARCAGKALDLVLIDPHGAALPGATLHATVTGRAMRLALAPPPVRASQVRGFALAVDGIPLPAARGGGK